MDVDVPFSFLTFLDNHGDLWHPYLILCTWDRCIHDDWEVWSCTTWPPEGARGYRLVRVFTLQVFHRLIWDQISPSTEHLLHDKDHSLSLRWKDVKFPWYTLGRQMYPSFVLNAISWQCFRQNVGWFFPFEWIKGKQQFLFNSQIHYALWIEIYLYSNEVAYVLNLFPLTYYFVIYYIVN